MSQAERQTTVDEQESTFRRLTQRATLAVIARAARRIVPLLVWEDQAEVFYWPVEGALRLAETLAAGGYVTASDASQAEEALRFKALNSEKRLWRDWADSLTKQHVRACAEHMAMATRFASFAAHGLDTCEGTRGEQEQRACRGRLPLPPSNLSQPGGRIGTTSWTRCLPQSGHCWLMAKPRTGDSVSPSTRGRTAH